MPLIHHLFLKRRVYALRFAIVLLSLLGSVFGAAAQTLPTITLGNAQPVLEGNVGTRTMRFPITLDAPTSRQVQGRFITRPSSLSSSATGGTTCNDPTDYLAVDVPFTIAANTLSTFVDVTICGDTRIEPAQEIVYVALVSVFGANCPSIGCVAAGVIIEDDAPGFITINSLTASRSTFGTTLLVPVRLSVPYGLPVTVDFTTASGSATGVATCPALSIFTVGDFQVTSGTVTFQPGETTANLSIRVCPTFSAAVETFTVGLSNASAPAHIFRAGATITLQGGGKVGVFSLGADEARIKVGDTVGYALQWTLPPGRVWRELGNIGLRIRSANKSLLWLNWNESSNLFSLCQRSGVRVGAYQFYGQGSEVDADDDDQDERQTLAVTCSAGALPGSSTVLETQHARLHLDSTRVVGSGPTGASVLLHLSISFKPSARGEAFFEVAASDDAGQVDPFARALSLVVHARERGH